MKVSNERKLEAVKKFLIKNNIGFEEKHYSKTYDLTMDLKIKKLRIAVFLSKGKEYEDRIYRTRSVRKQFHLAVLYKPFFIRDGESQKFVLEKLQNCIYDRMLLMQKHWMEKQNQNKDHVDCKR